MNTTIAAAHAAVAGRRELTRDEADAALAAAGLEVTPDSAIHPYATRYACYRPDEDPGYVKTARQIIELPRLAHIERTQQEKDAAEAQVRAADPVPSEPCSARYCSEPASMVASLGLTCAEHYDDFSG